MKPHWTLQSICRWVLAGAGLAVAGYTTYVGVTWFRYGRVPRSDPEEHDELLDRFMPVFDVVERHHVDVVAPASVTVAVARDMDLFESPVVRTIFKGRELILRASSQNRLQPRGLAEEMRSLGWVVLAEIPGREMIVGAVTEPWKANVTFRSVPSGEFASFNEPDYVKIVWTLRADPIGARRSVFRTETRAVATDRSARAKFRWYWSFLSPGIFLIRQVMLGPVKAEAERRVQLALSLLRAG